MYLKNNKKRPGPLQTLPTVNKNNLPGDVLIVQQEGNGARNAFHGDLFFQRVTDECFRIGHRPVAWREHKARRDPVNPKVRRELQGSHACQFGKALFTEVVCGIAGKVAIYLCVKDVNDRAFCSVPRKPLYQAQRRREVDGNVRLDIIDRTFRQGASSKRGRRVDKDVEVGKISKDAVKHFFSFPRF